MFVAFTTPRVGHPGFPHRRKRDLLTPARGLKESALKKVHFSTRGRAYRVRGKPRNVRYFLISRNTVCSSSPAEYRAPGTPAPAETRSPDSDAWFERIRAQKDSFLDSVKLSQCATRLENERSLLSSRYGVCKCYYGACRSRCDSNSSVESRN